MSSFNEEFDEELDEEWDQELERGKLASLELINHMLAMGADKMSLPITIDTGCYIVEVRKTI